jgi:hypothetical protein
MKKYIESYLYSFASKIKIMKDNGPFISNRRNIRKMGIQFDGEIMLLSRSK